MTDPRTQQQWEEIQRAWLELRKKFRLTPYIYAAEFNFRPEETAQVTVQKTIPITGLDFFAYRVVPVVSWPSLWGNDANHSVQLGFNFFQNSWLFAEAQYGLQIEANGTVIVEETPASEPPFHNRKTPRVLPGGFAVRQNSVIQLTVTRFAQPPYIVGADVRLEDLPDEVMQVAIHGFQLEPRDGREDFQEYKKEIDALFNQQPFTYHFTDAAGNVGTPVISPPAAGAQIGRVALNMQSDATPFWCRQWSFKCYHYGGLGPQGQPMFAASNIFGPQSPLCKVRLWDQYRIYQNIPLMFECLAGHEFSPIPVSGDWIFAPDAKISADVEVYFQYPDVGEGIPWILFGSGTGNYFRFKYALDQKIDGAEQRRIGHDIANRGY